MPPFSSVLSRFRFAFLGLLLGVLTTAGWAQTCGPNETLVTFRFSTTTSNNATGGTGTWTASSLGPGSRIVGLPTSGTANTLTFSMDSSGATFQPVPGGPAGNAPAQYSIGNMPDSLTLAMDAAAPGGQTGMTITFARPMNKVRFTMADVDMDPTGNGGGSDFQDRLQIAGYLGGTTVLPTTTPVGTASYYSTQTTTTLSGDFSQITRTDPTASCPHGDQTTTACNVTVDFSAPITSLRLNFLAGPLIAAPTLQYVGFNNFSFCEPNQPDLKLTKAASTTTFVAGQTGTYTFVASNVGGTPTSGNYTVTDVISTTGVTFPSPQSPGGGWTCIVGTTTFASDTASCSRSTALAVNGSATLTLTVAVSPGATNTPVVNQAKVWGGNDPNKTTLTSTGALTNCSAANEGLSGGGAGAGCAFESTTLARQGNLTVAKTNGVNAVLAGSTATYTLTFSNLGPSNADGTLIKDTSTAGLNCSATPATVTCTTLTGGATCPSGLPLGSATSSASVPNFFNATGITIPAFPVGGTVILSLACRVTATGS